MSANPTYIARSWNAATSSFTESMLPMLGLFQLQARDVMGYTFVVFLTLFPVVLILVTVLGMTLPYPL